MIIAPIFCFISTENTFALDGPSLLRYPDINIVDANFNTNKIIPADYATVVRPNSRMTYTIVGNSSGGAGGSAYFTAAVLKRPGPHYVQLNNVAIYQGNRIDLRVNIESTTGGTVRVYTPNYRANTKMEDFLRINTAGANKQTVIKYEYYKSGTEEKVDYSGTWNYRWITNYKSISLPKNQLYDVYAYYNSALKYNNYNDSNLQVFGTNTKQQNVIENAYSVLFDTNRGELYQVIDHLKTPTYTKYSFDPIAQMELPTPQIVGETTNAPDVQYEAVQDMPLQVKKTFYPISYRLDIKFKDADVIDFDQTTCKVYDLSGQSRDSYFRIVPDKINNQLVVNITNPMLLSSDSFVDNSYIFKIDAKLKSNKDLTQYYRTDGYYYIPAYVQYQTNTNLSPETMGIARVKAFISAEPKLQMVSQFENTNNWINQPVETFFDNAKGAFSSDKLIIKSVERKSFDRLGNDNVKVTLKGSISGIEKEFVVPVKVSAERTGTINYVDKQGKKIADSITKKGPAGSNYDFTSDQKEITGYKYVSLKDDSDPIKGKYPEETKNINVTFVYEVIEQDIKIKYVNEKEEEISEAKMEKAKPGDDYNVLAKKVPGYQVQNVRVDNIPGTLKEDGSVTVKVKEKAMEIVFKYQSNHFELNFTVDKTSSSPGETLNYTLDITSGMKYEDATKATDYQQLTISVPIDDKQLKDFQEIIIKDSKGNNVGEGRYDQTAKKIIGTLTKKVKNTENLAFTFKAKISEDIPSQSKINLKALVTSMYQSNGNRLISKESNEVSTVIDVVKMHFSQVYRGTETPILKDLTMDEPVDNSKYFYVKINESLENIVDKLVTSGDKELNYVGYNQVKMKDFKVKINNVISNTDKVPNKEFQLIYEYEGQMKFQKAPNLDFGQVEISDRNKQSKLATNSEDKVQIVNTLLGYNWTLKASLPNGIKNTSSGESFLGELLYIDKNGTKRSITESGIKLTSQEVEDKSISKLDIRGQDNTGMRLEQHLGNASSKYSGELVWSLEDTPK